MKKLSVFLFVLFLFQYSFSKQTPEALKLQSYQLKNGLTVYLNVDNSASSVMGMMAVKGGSSRDPEDATGIAHYFEHIMFKGSEKLGTTDYNSEKVYLDSIAAQYDLLGQSSDKKAREAIQVKINELSIEAAKYAIPNEFDRIINQMGGDNVNAFTSFDQIVYFNTFPSNQMENWLDVYSDRFENPVFRLFQSELETVYEEKNMYADELATPLFEGFLKELFPGTPYGDHTIIGSAEHLKNPSLSKMEEYYNTYYVPNNMALILTGNFDLDKTKPLIEEKFGHFSFKELPEHDKINLTPYQGRKQVNKRLMPIKIGLLGFHTVEQGHPDQLKLDVCARLLSNYSYTGLLDDLTNDNKLMEASIETMALREVGGQIVVILPKIIGQSIGKAEKLVWEKINQLKEGDFDDTLLDAVKLEMVKENQENIEDAKWRSLAIMESFLYDREWNEVLNYSDEISKLTKREIVEVANKYYGENYLAFYSKMGFPKKDKVDKPPYKAIAPKNTEAHSAYYNAISSAKVDVEEPRFIERVKDYNYYEWNDNASSYYVSNTINDIFSMDIKFKMGEVENPKVVIGSEVLNYCGTKDLAYADFLKEVQKLGGEIWNYSNDNYLNIRVSGLESNLKPILKLVNDLVMTPSFTENEKEKMIENLKMEKKWSSKDIGVKSDALMEYALYKDRSDFLLAPDKKELKKMSTEDLLALSKDVLKREVEIHYVGKIGDEVFAKLAKEELDFIEDREAFAPFLAKKKNVQEENIIYFMHDKKAIQSQIKMCVIAGKNETKDVFDSKIFNEYFCGNMGALVFQEIREFRSLAYHAGGRYVLPYDRSASGYYYGVMKTQADKTIDAIETYTNLLHDMPQKPERISGIKTSLKQSVNGKRPGFRRLSKGVPNWQYLGFTEDPNKMWYAKYDDISFDQVNRFYGEYIKDKPIVMTLIGDKSRIDMKELRKYGKVVEVKKKDIFK